MVRKVFKTSELRRGQKRNGGESGTLTCGGFPDSYMSDLSDKQLEGK